MNARSWFYWVFTPLLFAILAGCSPASAPELAPAEAPVAEPAQSPPATVDSPSAVEQKSEAAASALPNAPDPANATLLGIYDEPIALSEGLYEGAPFVSDSASRPRVALIPEMSLRGDLDGDGALETVAFVVENSGGTGNFLYLAVLHWDGAAVSNVGTKLVGDRVNIRNASIDGDSVVLDVVQCGPDDAACCPTELARRSWRLRAGTLEELPVETEGKLSLATLNGTAWRLRQFGFDSPDVEDVTVTLAFGEAGISGSSGCNQFNGSAKPGENPNGITIGPIAGTKKRCSPNVMETEEKFLAAMQGATQFGYEMRSLILTYKANGEFGQLVFDPAPSQE